MRKLYAEAIGTFFLVFMGTGAIVVNDVTGGAVSHVGVSLCFGLEALFAANFAAPLHIKIRKLKSKFRLQ